MEIGTLYLLDIIRYYLGVKILFKKKMRRLWIPVLGEIICFIAILIYRNNARGIEIISASAYFISILSILMMIEEEIKERLLYVLGLFTIFACLDELSGFFFNKILSGAIHKAILECVGSIILLLILLFFQKIRLKIKIKRIWLTFFIVLTSICVAIIIFAFSNAEYAQTFSGQMIYKVMLLIGYGCLIGLIAAALYIKEMNQKDQKLLNMEKCIKEMQRKYYLSLLERETDTRRYRHDINNHLMYLRKLADGNSEIHNYIDNLLEQPDINDVDFCTIFSNLLSNAVEEVERTSCIDPYIKIEIKTGKIYLMITIRNSSTTIIDNGKGNVMTKKRDKENHGMGLRNVCEAVSRNKGKFSLEGNGEEVSAQVILNLKTTVDGVI